MLRIPRSHRDLSRYVFRRDATRLGLYLLWTVAWLAGALYYNQGRLHLPEERLLLGWKLWLWMGIALVSGFLLLRIWRFFTDRTCHGIITQAALSRSYDNSPDPGVARRTDFDFRLNTSLRLVTPGGRRIRLRFEQKNGFYQYYHEGEEVLRLHGLPYPINLDPEAPHGFVCAACGQIHAEYQERCEVCAHTLLHPRELLDCLKK